MDIARTGKAIEKALSRLASPLHPNLLSDLASLSWVHPMSLQWVFCCTMKLSTWRTVTSIQLSLQFSKPKKNKQNETISLSKSSEHNFTFRAICQTAGFRRKMYQAEVWRNSWLLFCFFPSFHLARIKYFVFLFYMHQHASMGLYYFIHRWIKVGKKSHQCSYGTSAGLR